MLQSTTLGDTGHVNPTANMPGGIAVGNHLTKGTLGIEVLWLLNP